MELRAFLDRLQGVTASGNGYLALCPAHSDHRPSLSVSEHDGKILVNCFVGCTAEHIVAALGLQMNDLFTEPVAAKPSPSEGCTLAEYANAKRLDPETLTSWGIHQETYQGKPCICIPYYGENGRNLRTRRRKAMLKTEGADRRFDWCKGTGVAMYGLWKLQECTERGYALVVEGESDCHACWQNGIPALGVPGASTWKAEWAKPLAGLRVMVWHEGDSGGMSLIQRVAQDLPAAQVIRRPKAFKDLSEAHAQGVDIRRFVQEAMEHAKPIATEVATDEQTTKTTEDDGLLTAERLQDLAPWVSDKLNHQLRRETKEIIASKLCEWLLRHHRLMVDVTQDEAKRGRPYVVDDDSSIWHVERHSRAIELLLFRAGLNPAEEAYSFVLKNLELKAVTDGTRVSLCSWQTSKDSTLYISCGPSALVRVRNGHLEKLPNGTDDVWFVGTAVYPTWSPTAPMQPQDLAAFKPALTTPHEVPLYTPAVQHVLIDVWLISLLSGLRPTPIAAAIGQKGGGKTELGRACVRLLLGQGSDVTSIPTDKRDYAAITTNQPIVVFDNVDTDIPTWFADELAGTATGKEIQARKLFTDGNLISRPQTAAVYVSTRTAAFCRPDIAERLLPVLTTEFADDRRIADSDLLAEVDANREAVLSWCAIKAGELLSVRQQAPRGLPLRFVDFARMVWAYMKTQDRPELAAGHLQALRRAQALAVGEGDPLTQEIVAHFDRIVAGGHLWRGSASDLVRALKADGADLPFYGGGKAVATQLREAKPTLALFGLSLSEQRSGSNTLFMLHGTVEGQGNGENGKCVDCGRDETLPNVNVCREDIRRIPVFPVSPPGEAPRDNTLGFESEAVERPF
ncbi:MAG: hypothetical protein GX601_18000 [Anaerolineales bacterium]|nr:hypothetical protein [Anaerolineales bacterium]